MPAIVVFILMGIMLSLNKAGDILNIPRSQYSYAKVLVKTDRGEKMGLRKPLFYNYSMIFEFPDLRIIELTVPKKLFYSVSKDSRGVLVHTDSRFRGFHADKKIPDIIDLKKKNKKKRR